MKENFSSLSAECGEKIFLSTFEIFLAKINFPYQVQTKKLLRNKSFTNVEAFSRAQSSRAQANEGEVN